MPSVTELKASGHAAYASGRVQDALDLYTQAGRRAPDDAEIWHMLAILHATAGHADRAEDCCRKVIALQPNAPTAYNNLGTLVKNKGRLKEARECYRKALDIAPDYAPAHNNLATVLRQTGDRDGALAHYGDAVRLRPDYAEAHSNLGVLLQDTGRLAEALQAYKKAVELQPTNVTWLFNFACGLREAGQMPDAERLYQAALQLDPNNAPAWDGLSHAQLELRKFDDALSSGLRAIELDDSLTGAYLHAAAAARAVQKTDQATDLLQRALAIDPDNETARYFLAIMGEDALPDKSPEEYVRQLFDGYAETFDDSLVKTLEYRTPMLLRDLATRLLPPAAGKLHIIDLGCGTGLCGPLFRPLAERLTGVDLSPKMVAKARGLGCYDELIVGDLLPPLHANPQGFDLVLAADVFVYIGDLAPVIAATVDALRPGGLFLFSTEADDAGGDFVLRSSGRYAHGPRYVQDLAHEHGLETVASEQVKLRKENGVYLTGTLFAFRRI